MLQKIKRVDSVFLGKKDGIFTNDLSSGEIKPGGFRETERWVRED